MTLAPTRPRTPARRAARRDPLGPLLRTLPDAHREHVLLLRPDGTLTGTSRALQDAFTVVHVPALRAAADGPAGVFAGLLSIFTPRAGGRGVHVECQDEKSGPYRRVYSKPGYAYQASRVYLPTDTTGEMKEEKNAGHGDTAFVYMGGWGGRGGAVDAGFQHGRYGGGAQDDWAPFFLVQQVGAASAVTVARDKQASGAPWRLLAGQSASLKFWVSRVDGQPHVNMTAMGTTSVDHTQSTLTLSAPVDASFDWNPEGGANILKRMTTIGQTYGQQNLQSGSFMRGVRWSDSLIGQTEAAAHLWGADDTGGYCSFPDPKAPEGQRADGSGPKWTVQFVSAAEETDSVVLQ
ncbi:hypothetical protein [Deinococcus maricopensis]|uniref:Uncharacterized protein n=1 Tax=Deinococcus maricopensis (strain DSM 21211 / LMG 22137 / NRRL B-23946 / LB-34) TaxID=709986 RepID=E8U5I1_DEIML|nr:hypothetical protein [Deinococcus maricopensis]ADV66320.1 hypothetical protein Deima_0663 [Deinococcus maricopensis DSM 21211]